MKPAPLFLFAVFLYLSTAAQQPDNILRYDFKYYLTTTYKIIASLEQPGNSTGFAQIQTYSLAPSKTGHDFSSLRQNLVTDMYHFKLQKKNEDWTNMVNGLLNSYYRERWIQNKSNVQQRWMIQNLKRQ